MKKSIHPIIIVSIIILLLLLIILPPTLRTFYPKIEKTKAVSKDKITLVICTKESDTEQVSVKSQTRYINNKISENRITFSKVVTARTLPGAEKMALDEPSSISEELFFLQQIPNIKIETKEETTIITITADTLAKNPDNQQLATYFNQNINTQKISYAQKSYNCETSTS